MVDPKTYAYGNRSHFVMATTRRDHGFTVYDKDQVLGSQDGQQDPDDDPPAFPLYIDRGTGPKALRGSF